MADLPTRRSVSEYKWLAMTVVSVGTFMSTLDASIVNVSLPAIMSSLRTDLAAVQWVVSIYLLVITGLLLTLGRLSDMAGRKPIFIAGFAIFTIGSLLCGLSRTVHLLIAFRGFQAIGSAMMMANGPAILTDVFPPEERGKAMGMYGTVVACGLTVGPAFGGFLVAAAGWPLIFFINIPIGIIGIAMAQVILRDESRPCERNFDVPGALLLLISLISLTLALSHGPKGGWDSERVWSLLGAFTLFGALFIVREMRAEHPVVDPALFRSRLFAAASASALIAYAAMFSVTFLMPFYLSEVLGYGSQKIGMTLVAVPLTIAVIAPFSGSLSDRIGSRIPASLGLAVSAVGLLLIGHLGMNPGQAHVIGALLVVGIGSAVFQTPNSSAIMGAVPQERRGVAAGVLATMRNLGMVIGISVSGAVYTSYKAYYIAQLGVLAGSVHAFRNAFLVAAVICAVGVITAAARGSAVPETASEARIGN